MASEHGQVQSLAERAYDLRVQGKTNGEIASILDINYQDVWTLLEQRLTYEKATVTAEERKSLLQLELDRLDALQQAHWTAAMMGDPKSSEMVLKVITQRAKLLGLDALDTQTQQQQVLVVGGAEKDYIKGLMSAG